MKLQKILIFLALSIFLNACSDDKTPDEKGPIRPPIPEIKIELSVSPNEDIALSHKGETVTFSVETNADKWVATLGDDDDKEHFRILPSADSFLLIANENIHPAEKTATVTVTATTSDKSESVSIDVVQTFIPIDYYFKIKPAQDAYEFGFGGGEVRFNVETNVRAWSVELDDDSWFGVGQRIDYFDVEAPGNYSATQTREAKVIITSEDLGEPVTIALTQAPMLGLHIWEGYYFGWGIKDDDERFEFNSNNERHWSYVRESIAGDWGEHMIMWGPFGNNLMMKYNTAGFIFCFDFAYGFDIAGMGSIDVLPIIIDDDGEKIILDRSLGTPYSEIFLDAENLTFYTGGFTHTHNGKEYPVYYGYFENLPGISVSWSPLIFKELYWELIDFTEPVLDEE